MKLRFRFLALASTLVGAFLAIPCYAFHCEFNGTKLSFGGTPIEQARCLLSPVMLWGRVGSPNKKIPDVFEKIVGEECSVSIGAFRKYLSDNGINEADVGGNLDIKLSRAHDGKKTTPEVRYFVLHDTSSPYLKDAPFPENIDSPSMPGNKPSAWKKGGAHVFIVRTGDSVTAVDFKTPWRATKFELKYGSEALKGLFLHVELIQPRKRAPGGGSGNDAFAPKPGFSKAQYQRLAVVYFAASMRSGRWLIPAFHAVLDDGFKDAHDDPQNFSLEDWSVEIEKLLGVFGITANHGKGLQAP